MSKFDQARYLVGGQMVARAKEGTVTIDPYDTSHDPMYIRNRRTGAVISVPKYLGLQRLQDIRTDGSGMAFEQVTEDQWLEYEEQVLAEDKAFHKRYEETGRVIARPSVKTQKTVKQAAPIAENITQSVDKVDELSRKIDRLTDAIIQLVGTKQEKKRSMK